MEDRLINITMSKPDKIVDSLLVIAHQAGDKNALNLLVKRWNKRLCVQAYRYLSDWDLAKDITQDSWSTILRKIHMLKDANSFGSWAITIVSRKSMDRLKAHKRDRKEIKEFYKDSQNVMEEETYSKEAQMNQVMEIISGLPLAQRMVLKLFYLEEYSLKDIGQIMGTSANTVKTRLFRAREKIRDELKNINNEKKS